MVQINTSTDEDPSIQSLDDVDQVVDADAHVNETFEDLLPYVEDSAAEQLLKKSSLPYTEIYSLTLSSPPFLDQGFHEEDSADNLTNTTGVDGLVAEFDEFGIDAGVVDPTLSLAVTTINNPRFAVALSSAYNSWILNEIDGSGDGRVKANMMVAAQKPGRAAEEIDRRANEDAVVGVQLSANGLVPPAGHEMYDPIYQAAEDNDLPIVLHTAGNIAKSFPLQFYWNETFAEDHALRHPYAHMWNLTTIMFRGVPERFPDLEFSFEEAGIGYVPYLIGRLDDHFLQYGYEIPHLNKLPSEYVKDQFYFTTQPLGHTPNNPRQIAYWIDMIGPESVMYSADLPHADFDPPKELFDRIRPHFESDDVERMMGGNANAVFDIEP